MTKHEQQHSKSWRSRLAELTSAVTMLAMQVKDMSELVEAPKWFIKEFGSGDPGVEINDARLTAEGWRVLAIGLRS